METIGRSCDNFRHRSYLPGANRLKRYDIQIVRVQRPSLGAS